MILIGSYLSPYTRRVAIALQSYGLPYRHDALNAIADGDQLAPHNPLRRVPTLILDDGSALIESGAILDHLDELAKPGEALIAPSGPERRATLRIVAMATGVCDKMIALIYERMHHETPAAAYAERCGLQVEGGLAALEAECAARTTPFLFGERPTHADVAIACMASLLAKVSPDAVAPAARPALAALVGRCEALAPFQATAPAA